MNPDGRLPPDFDIGTSLGEIINFPRISSLQLNMENRQINYYSVFLMLVNSTFTERIIILRSAR